MTDQTAALAYLQRDPLRHITMLKLLHAYGATLECRSVEQGGEAGVLLAYPPARFPYDGATYPYAERIVVFASSGPNAAEALLDFVPSGAPVVFKVVNPGDRAAVVARFTPRLVNTFASYTSAPQSVWPALPEVRITAALDEHCLERFIAMGHDRDEVLAHFATGGARCFAVYRDDEPLALCYTYQNFGPIWEVAGVSTAPEARRSGLGRRVVGAALHDLLAQERIPRYQVYAGNAPSIALAEAIGLVRFVTIEHFACGVVSP